MRILVLNANTTAFVTETAAAEARRVASPGTEIVPVTADFGAAIVATRTEHAIAEHAAVALAARHAPGCAAVVIAVSYDTGLKAVREMLAVPVVGMTEAALLTACMLGGKIGLVSFGRRVWPIYRELIDGYGLSGRIAGFRVLESTSAYHPGDTSALDAEVAATACALIQQDGAESIVVLGAVMAGIARRIEDRVPVPVLDGMRCAIPQAELLVRMRLPKPTTGSYAAPGERSISGLDPAFAPLLDRRPSSESARTPVRPPLRQHGRYPYLPIIEPPPFRWPRGEGLAVYVALNLEAYSFGEGMTDELVPASPAPDVLNYSWLDYGNRVGAWRILELCRELELPLTVLVNSRIYEVCPDLIAAFRDAGCEIAAHGRTNAERQGQLPEAEERKLIAEATSEIAKREGRHPRGWLGPWISESEATPDLLKEAGYDYVLDWCCDDRPIPLATRAGPLLSVPYPQEANDANAIAVRRMNADAFAGLVVDQFDEMLRQARSSALVCPISLHPHISGQAHRIGQLRRALTHIASQRERIWAGRAGDIADVAIKGYAIS